jgi:uncharacterized protein YndB with AHSA1/START domain
MQTTKVEQAVRCWVVVDASLEWTFDTFTRDARSWWPVEAFSSRPAVGPGATDGVQLEPWQGGRLVERSGTGERRLGTVLVWDPPRRVVLEWERDAEVPPTEVEIVFAPEGEDTRVDLAHTGWEYGGPIGIEGRARYAGTRGWEMVLRRFADSVGG